jgi:hypothetical protein
MLPTVLDNCMGTLLPVGPPVVSAKPVCEGTRTYTYTYTIAKAIHIHGYLPTP